MEDKIFKINAYLYNGLESEEPIIYYQNDTEQCGIEVLFFGADSLAYDITATQPVVVVDKSDGTEVIENMTIDSVENNKAALILHSQSIASIGKNTMTIILYGNDGQRQTFGSLKFTVKNDGLTDGILSDTNYPILTNLLSEVRNLEDDVISSEYDRNVKEGQRVQAEEYRTIDENERKQAEEERGQNEAFRQNAESLRNSSETLRVDNETNRVAQENTRINNEYDRVSNENERITNEATRQSYFNTVTNDITTLSGDLGTKIQQGTALNTELETTMANAQDDINTINSSAAYSKIIYTSDWVFDGTEGKYKFTIDNHNLNSKDLVVTVTNNTTGRSIVEDFQVLGLTSVVIFSEDTSETRVSIVARYYNNTGGQDIANEVVEARMGEASLLDNIANIYSRSSQNESDIVAIYSSLADSMKKTESIISVKEFGAKGDYNRVTQTGTDDSLSFQQAFDYANANGVKLYIPNGNYLLTSSITLRENGAYLVEGSNANINAYNYDKNNCVITCTTTNLFVGETVGAMTGVQLTISKLHFYKPSGTKESCLFKDIKLVASRFYLNSVLGYGSIVKGKLEIVTKFYDNFIEAIRDGFLTKSQYDDGANLVDSEIYNNYLNGEPNSNITMFQLTSPAYSIIHDNFIDFCKYVFAGYNATGIYYDVIRNIRVYNNTFDYCFRFIPENHFIRYSILTNNKFAKFSATYKSSFPSLDTDMNTKSWGVFISPLFDLVTIDDSFIENCDNFVNCTGNQSKVKVKMIGTQYATQPSGVKVNYQVSTSADLSDTYIDELEYKQFTTFPTQPSGGYVFYNNQNIIYNNKLLRFYNGSFYDAMGTVVTS